MDLYETRLKAAAKKGIHRNIRGYYIQQILIAIMELHNRDLCHADLKPGNILVNIRNRKLALGDLGFVSNYKYAKVERTAPLYRDPEPRRLKGHDIYSLGIIIVEIIGGEKLKKQPTYREIAEVAKRLLKGTKYLDITLKMLDSNHNNRPDANDIYEYLYQSNFPVSIKPVHYTAGKWSDKHNAKEWLYEKAKKFDINRKSRGFSALNHFMRLHKEYQSEWKVYGYAILLILSSNFGAAYIFKKINIKESAKYAAHNMLKDTNVVSMLLMP